MNKGRLIKTVSAVSTLVMLIRNGLGYASGSLSCFI